MPGPIWPHAQHTVFSAGMAPKTMHEGVARLAILLLLLPTVMETDLLLVKRRVLLQNCSMAVLAGAD
jgi:hypothetical protein